MKKGYQVFEYSANGGKHSLSKVYPTWLGAKRVRNRIARSLVALRGYRWVVEEVNC